MANITETLIKVNQYIDTHQDRMIADLREICAIKSVAGSKEHTNEMPRMVRWLEARLKHLKASTCERFDIGSYTVDGQTIKLPTVILAAFGKDDTKKRTVLVYGRYDVKSATAGEWSTDDPWDVVQSDGVLHGRGTCRGKGPLLSWLHAIEAYVMQRLPLPVNIKFIVEGMSERNCFGLEEFLYTKRITFLKGIDYVLINQSEWLNDTIPCISYGTCGICQFDLMCSGAGGSGDSSFEPQAIIDYILKSFVDPVGNILIANINDDVVQISPEIEQSLEKVDCDLSRIKKNLPPFMRTWSKQKILLRMWQMPQLIANGETATVSCSCGDGDVDGGGGGGGGALSTTFVLKIVPVQTPDRCAQSIMEHIVQLMQKRFGKASYNVQMQKAKNGKRMVCRILNGKAELGSVRLVLTSETRAWQEDSVSPHYEATKRASLRVFKNPPNLIKESRDIPIILILDKVRSMT